MPKNSINKALNILIAAVWLLNGLFCKVMDMVPRHQAIVERILGGDHARIITVLIGCAEVAMAAWILTGIKTRLNVITQVVVIAVMNTLEFFLAPDLLLWGRGNAVFALLFLLFICCNEFYLRIKTQPVASNA